jgi:hypothetical protein
MAHLYTFTYICVCVDGKICLKYVRSYSGKLMTTMKSKKFYRKYISVKIVPNSLLVGSEEL